MGKAPPDSAQYRDAHLGAEARRDHLLTRARAELAAQPLEVRRIFVTRASTAAAAVALAVGGFATALVAASPDLYSSLASVLPGRHPAVAASVLGTTLGLSVLVYFIARALAEEHFTRAMLRTANPSTDTFHDLERLRHTPTREALRLAERARHPARMALTIGFAAVAAPLAIAANAIMSKDAWANPGTLDTLLALVGPSLLQAALIGVSLGAVVTHFARSSYAALILGSCGIIAACGGALAGGSGGDAIWGIMLIGVAAGLRLAQVSEAKQARYVVAAAARL